MKRTSRHLTLFLVFCCGFNSLAEDGDVSAVKSDERIVFFPTEARLGTNGQSWLVPVHGWIFEPEDDDLLRGASLKAFQKTLGLDPSLQTTSLFKTRASLFLADNERKKRIVIRIGEDTHRLEPSDVDGHFGGIVRVPVRKATTLTANDKLTFAAVLQQDDSRTFSGVAHLLQPEGISVISDIDDTIKVTQVTDKKKLLENTFFRPFRAVDGMAELYDRWANAGAAFHFVSSAPWQLYEPLSNFAQRAGFPDATYHLKSIRLKDASFLSLFADPEKTKPQVIQPLLRAYPKRKFILVGDSGEKDPEVYAAIATAFPDQIVSIFIRDVTEESEDSNRYRVAFEGIPITKWKIFYDPNSLKMPEQQRRRED